MQLEPGDIVSFCSICGKYTYGDGGFCSHCGRCVNEIEEREKNKITNVILEDIHMCGPIYQKLMKIITSEIELYQ